MNKSESALERRTTAEDVYDRLHADILSLRLLPGDKLSEVEIARQLEVSRQPVREAFIRLSNAGLLLVRPQRATEVRRISPSALRNTRFLRLAVELEVIQTACSTNTDAFHARFDANLNQQKKAIDAGKPNRYHELDYKFHHLLCKSADREFAYATVKSSKSQVDRLCLLSLSDTVEMLETYKDHCQLVASIKENRSKEALLIMRAHLSRLDAAIEAIRLEHAEYFDEH
ncbi:MAG: GntR family transcriptional regulator [Pseudomonadales bacterium]